MKSVTVCFTPRERFSVAARSLDALYANAGISFDLVLVDTLTPTRYRREIEAALAGKDAKIIKADHYLLPNQCKNLALTGVTGEYIFFLENDCLIRPACLARLIAAAEEFPAPVAVPLIFEGSSGSGLIHHDPGLGSIQTGPTGAVSILPDRQRLKPRPKEPERVRTDSFEHHCFLIRRDVITKIGPFDPGLNIDEHLDTCLKLHRAGIPVVLETAAGVDFYAPPPIHSDEMEFFRFRWDKNMAAAGKKRLVDSWKLPEYLRDPWFAEHQAWRTNRLSWFLINIPTNMRRLLYRIKCAIFNP